MSARRGETVRQGRRAAPWAAALLALSLAGLSAPALAAAQDPSVELHHLLLRPGPQGTLLVQERLVFNNPGAPLASGKVKFYLPDGARQVTVLGQESGALEARDGVVLVRRPVPAGQSSYGFAYVLSSGGAPHFVLRHKSDFPTVLMYILTPPQGLEVKAEQVKDRGLESLDGQQFRIFEAAHLPPGQDVGLAVTVDAGAASGGGALSRKSGVKFHNPGHIRLWYQSPFRGLNAHLFLVIVIAVPLAAVAFHLVQRRRRKAAEGLRAGDSEEELFQRLRLREKVLLEKMRQLERQRLNREVGQDTYERLREAYKQRLIQVKAQLRRLVAEV